MHLLYAPDSLAILQEVYRNVENWQPQKLIAHDYRLSDGNACAIGTDKAIFDSPRARWNTNFTLKYGLMGSSGIFQEIQSQNDNFVGSDAARWEHMTKWLLDQIQNHPDYIKPEVDTNTLVVV